MLHRLITNTAKNVLLATSFFISFQSSAQTNSWYELPNAGLGTAQPRFEDIYFADTNTGYAVSISGYFYKTADGGASWTGSYLGTVSLRSVDFIDSVGIVGTLGYSVFRTVNYGASWDNITSIIAAPSGSPEMCGLAHFGNTFCGVGWWGSAKATFYKSPDLGLSWSSTLLDTGLVTGLVDVVFTSADTGFITGCKNTTGNWLLANESVILKTTNGGNTWTKVFSDTTIGGRIWKIQFLNPQVGFASIEPYYDPDTANMVKTTDGGNTWTIIPAGRIHNNTEQVTGVQGVGFATEQTGWLGGWFNGLFETHNGGVTWDTIPFGTDFNRFQVMDSNFVFAGGRVIYKWGSHNTDAVKGPATATSRTTNKLYPIQPNPSSGKLKIEYDIKSETHVVMELANIDMRRHVQIFSKRLKPGHYTTDYDASNLPDGHYIIWMGTDEIPLTQKFTLFK